jgi:hypothetical protein
LIIAFNMPKSKYTYEEPTLKRSNSATKIQARFRGVQSRQSNHKKSHRSASNSSRSNNKNNRLVRKNSATTIQARVRGKQARSNNRTTTTTTLVRTNSATKIQARVRGTQERHRHQKATDTSYDNNTTSQQQNDPELQRLRDRVRTLQTTYRNHRQNGEKGKMQMALLDFDIANNELLRAMAYRDQAHSKQRDQELNGCLSLACLPCLLLCQFCCCVSTGAVGERNKTVKERDETIAKLASLGKDIVMNRNEKKRKMKGEGHGGVPRQRKDMYR